MYRSALHPSLSNIAVPVLMQAGSGSADTIAGMDTPMCGFLATGSSHRTGMLCGSTAAGIMNVAAGIGKKVAGAKSQSGTIPSAPF
jgi:hypothetical protein